MTYFHNITGCNLALSLMFTSPFDKNVLFKLGDLTYLLFSQTYYYRLAHTYIDTLWVMEVEQGRWEASQP